MFIRSSEPTWLLALCFCCLVGAVASAQQQSGTNTATHVVQVRVHPLDSVEGPALYREYCVQCHGADGHGRTSGALHVPDLTTIAVRNGGSFPRNHVMFHIEGAEHASDALVRHSNGPGDMPHWAPLFKSMWPRDPGRCRVCAVNLMREIEQMQSSQRP